MLLTLIQYSPKKLRTSANVYPAKLDSNCDLLKCLQTPPAAEGASAELVAQRRHGCVLVVPKIVSTADGLKLDELKSHFLQLFTATGSKKKKKTFIEAKPTILCG